MRAPDPSSVRVPGPWSHREVSANGIRQHVVECGDGPLVVLLHGFPEFWWTWRHQLVALAEGGFRAVAVDLRGYGDTDKPPRGYDLWTLAGDAAGLIGALGDTRAHVVGHDWGGLIAWTMTALQPRRVRSLTVLGAPHPLAVRSQFVRDLRGQGRATASYALAFQVPRWPERALRVDDEGAPADLAAAGDTRTYLDLLTPEALADIATFADGIGPYKDLVIARNADGTLGSTTSLVADAHAAGLLVHPYTFRNENQFLPVGLRTAGGPTDYGDAFAEYAAFYATGIDGVFADNPDTAVAARALHRAA
ncbi:alpha/beta fold hydrolase [Pseudonocardia sp. KRD-188]|uniref:alpha/beta fold hydrolase n=1 Tax=Pseudonocardia oceani TaxID=2792013 RepID=UPI001C4A4758|nr:alpha/beta fold hydrolase [Pseudonocardia oceani]MBW0092889.1 alpha/beta fold hydrolase [Pseudonocardia oceani]